MTPEVNMLALKLLTCNSGETKLFISQEYIEPDFQGGPMVNHHLRDLAKLRPGDGGECCTCRLKTDLSNDLFQMLGLHSSSTKTCTMVKMAVVKV